MLTLAVLFLMSGCNKEDQPVPGEIIYGKNVFKITVDGLEREYLVHVPQNYDGTRKTPVVFMVHGTGGQGIDMYNVSGWVDVGETENILTVYPSALRHCIIDEDGINKTVSKWNSQPTDNWSFCKGVTPPDDIKFLRSVISELPRKYRIDEKRVYLVGFSNGGQMASKCSVELSDKLAAVVESASSFSIDTAFSPKRKLPVSFQIGNDDHGPGGEGPELPMGNFEKVFNTPGNKLNIVAQAHIKSFDLNPAYTMSGDTNTVVIATFQPRDKSRNVFNLALIKNLKHAYPNGKNHWMEAATVHWEWMKQFTLP